MAASPTESSLAAWAPSTSPLRIEYSTAVMENIRARAVEGYYKLMRGGVEVAGLLIGEVRDDGIRILGQQPFEIEYAYGPVFLLSPRDQEFLRGLVAEVEAELSDSQRHVVGFYVSHSRGELSPKENEIDLLQQVFPEPWQTLLLLKPSRAPETPAAFFVREADGQVRPGKSHLEFELSPHMGERRERPVPRTRTADASLRALAQASTKAEAPALPRPTVNPETGEIIPAALANPSSGVRPPDVTTSVASTSLSPPAGEGNRHVIDPYPATEGLGASYPPPNQVPPAASPRIRPATPPPLPPSMAWEEMDASTARASALMRYAIPLAALALLLVLGYFAYQFLVTEPEHVVVYTRESGGRIEAVWQLSGISDATSATITIANGNQTKTIDLMQNGGLSGSVSDPLLTPDAVVTLDIRRRDHPPIHEVARMMGVSTLARQQENALFPPDRQTTVDDVLGSEDTPSEPDAVGVAATEPVAPEPVTSAVPELPKPSPEPPAPARAEAEIARPSVPEIPSSASGSQADQTTSAARAIEAAQTSSTPTPASTAIGEQSPSAVNRQENQPVLRTSPPSDNRPVLPIEEPAARPPASEPPRSTPEAVGATSSRPAEAVRRPSAPAKPRAGRMIWTGQLRKNQTLQITGGDASQGAVNASLPGTPVRVNVLPGELTANGLVVYTANPRYRDSASAIEEPGPTNGWNRTRYRYDPLRANSIIVTAIPNQTNRWQGISVRNDERTVNVIVIDWLADAEN
jgi:hypothetical protein